MSGVESPAASSEVSAEQRDAILGTLHSVLDSTHFRKSKRYPALLEFVVLNALEDDAEPPKERTVGMKVFGRPGDYDTSSDPVVRIAAGEVRRRLALYFGENPTAPVRIDLPAGSYKAEFYFRSKAGNGMSLTPQGVPLPVSEPSPLPSEGGEYLGPANKTTLLEPASAPRNTSSYPARLSTRSRVKVLVGVLVVLAAVIGTGFWSYWHGRTRQDFWSPLLASNQPVQLLVGQNKAVAGMTAKNRQEKEAYGPAGPPHLVIDDAIVAAQICGTIRKYERDCEISPGDPVNAEQLQNKPVVVVGGFNNSWSTLLLGPLRYTIRNDHPNGAVVRSVVERTANGEVLLRNMDEKSTSDLSKDYAIIARFRSDITDGMVVVVAGMGIPGTRVAGEYVTSPEKMREVLARAPKGWQGVNVEAVLEVNLVKGNPGRSEVIATDFW